MEREGLACRYDSKSPDRSLLLNAEQECIIEEDRDGMSRECGFERGSWNTRIFTRHILERFGVSYNRSAIRLAHQLGLSVRKLPICPVQQRHTGGAE